MKYCLLFSLIILMLYACSEQAPDYSSQLKSILSGRIRNLDSTATIDSFRLIGMQPITAKLGLKINDSVYKISYYKVVRQLTAVKNSGRLDSIAFYQNEMTYMQGQLDSFARNIAAADTADTNFGKFASCFYRYKRKENRHSDTAYFFFDKHMNLLNLELLDSMLSRSMQQWRGGLN